jgi:hypothetical protein
VAEGFVDGQPRAWLRAEGLFTLAVAAALYGISDAAWLWFAVLFFAPDVSFLGYLAGSKVGGAAYNVMHSYVSPLALSVALLFSSESVGLPLIWFAHIGFDRALGFGLKYPSAFHDTHLGRIGRTSEPQR